MTGNFKTISSDAASCYFSLLYDIFLDVSGTGAMLFVNTKQGFIFVQISKMVLETEQGELERPLKALKSFFVPFFLTARASSFSIFIFIHL